MASKNAVLYYEFYIQANAEGPADGTLEAPFAALGSAYAAALSLDPNGCFTFTLRAGTYYMPSPLCISECSFQSITVRNYKDEHVTLTGKVPVSTGWEKYDENIYVCQLKKGLSIDALFADNKKQILARYPNYTPGAVLGGYSADCISPGRIKRWKDPARGYIRALHDREWGSNSYIITGKASDDTLELRWVGDNNRGSAMHPVKRMVENIFEELDSPGEWYYNPMSGKLFYFPAEGIDIQKAVFSITTSSELIHIEGESSLKPVSNLLLEGLHFEHTHRTMFTEPYERPLRGDWGMVRKGVITVKNAENITITSCSFSDIGGNAVVFSGYNKNHLTSNCDFTSIGATGVLIMGYMSAVRTPSTYDGDRHLTAIEDFIPGPRTEDYPRRITVCGSYFYDIGTYEKQTAAVCMSVSMDITVRGNTIHHTSRAGINVHDGTFGGHLIEGNDLFDCVTETADHGPINCWGRDRYWSVLQHDGMGYYGREKRPFALLDAVKTTIIRRNRVYANHAFGIDIDDGASNYDIYDNLCIGVGIKTRDGFDRRVHNNILIGAGFEIHMSFAHNNDLFYTNIVCNPKIYNLLCVNEGSTTIYSNNLYYNMGNPVISLPHNDFHSLIADPKFIDFEGNRFELNPGSPALSMGFVPFPVSDEDFGRKDCPNPPRYVYVPVNEDEEYQFYDVKLCNITGEGIRSAAGLPDLNGVYIAARDVLGLFCKLGLPIGVGDVIRSINGTPIMDIDSFLEEFDAIPLNIPVKIIIFRSQNPMELEFIKATNDYRSISEEASEAWKENAALLYNG